MISLTSQRSGGIGPMSRVLEWKGTGSLERTGRRNEKRVLTFVLVTSWSPYSFTWGWMRSQIRAQVSGLKGGRDK